MNLPNHTAAIIPPAKLTDYLLSPTHPDGQSKARFFGRFGFTQGQPQALADALLRHAADNEVTETEQTPFGMKYKIAGPLHAPDGRSPNVMVVWIIESGSAEPKLVTAYPAGT